MNAKKSKHFLVPASKTGEAACFVHCDPEQTAYFTWWSDSQSN